MKTYPPDVENMIASNHVKFAHTVFLDLGIPMGFTDAGFDIDHEGVTYSSDGNFLGMEEFTRKSGLSVTEITIGFSMVDQVITQQVLTGNYYKKPFKILRHFLSEDNRILHSEKVWEGRMTQHSDDENSATMTLTVKGVWAEFERVNSWRTTIESHERRYPGDKCFKYAAKAAETVYWAGTTTNSGGVGGGSSGSRLNNARINRD